MDLEQQFSLLIDNSTQLLDRSAKADKNIQSLLDWSATADKNIQSLLTWSSTADKNFQLLLGWSGRAESRLQSLVDRADQVDEHLDRIRAEMAVKKDFSEVKEEIRIGTRAMRHYTAYVENLLDSVTKKQLSVEDQLEGVRARLDQMQRRIEDLEKRNPAA